MAVINWCASQMMIIKRIPFFILKLFSEKFETTKQDLIKVPKLLKSIDWVLKHCVPVINTPMSPPSLGILITVVRGNICNKIPALYAEVYWF